MYITRCPNYYKDSEIEFLWWHICGNRVMIFRVFLGVVSLFSEFHSTCNHCFHYVSLKFHSLSIHFISSWCSFLVRNIKALTTIIFMWLAERHWIFGIEVLRWNKANCVDDRWLHHAYIDSNSWEMCMRFSKRYEKRHKHENCVAV